MPKYLQRRISGWARTSLRLTSVVAMLLVAVAIGVSVTTARPTTSGATVRILGAYGGGRLMAANPNAGYWTTTFAGNVTAYGGAPALGSPASFGIHLNQPILSMAATPSGHGYWLVDASDGGVFSFGNASFTGRPDRSTSTSRSSA